MDVQHRSRLIVVSLALGWAFDLLFWNHTASISFFLYVTVITLTGLALAWAEGVRPPARSLILAAAAIGFGSVSFLRGDPLTIFTSVLMTLTAMGALVLTLRSGAWTRYSLVDMARGAFELAGAGLLGGIEMQLRSAKQTAEAAPPEPQPARPARWKAALPALRGVLLALPPVLILGLLLSSADPVFAKRMGSFFEIFAPERWIELGFRAVYVLIFAYVVAGVLRYALVKSQDESRLVSSRDWVTPFLGWTEGMIVLGAVNALFLFFVAIQFQYLFGGQNNIVAEGFTYAEYARRGFSELLATAFITLALFQAAATVTRRENAAQRRSFSAMGITLFLLTAVILVSAYQRLQLYELAYGFSRIRTYSHVLIFWLGALLLAGVLLEAARRRWLFGLAALAAVSGFAATLAVMNVDGWIVRQNAARDEIDVNYLMELSDDAAPELARQYAAASDPVKKQALAGALACRIVEWDIWHDEEDWTGFNLPERLAGEELARVQPQLPAYRWTFEEGVGDVVWMGEQKILCAPNGYPMD